MLLHHQQPTTQPNDLNYGNLFRTNLPNNNRFNTSFYTFEHLKRRLNKILNYNVNINSNSLYIFFKNLHSFFLEELFFHHKHVYLLNHLWNEYNDHYYFLLSV